MMKSRNLIRDMFSRCRENEIEEAANKAQAQEFAAATAVAAKKEVMIKAAVHERVIDTSFRCMRDIEDATLQMEDAAVKLKHERMAGFAALQVCIRRQDLREKRPKAEMFADALSEALTRERQLLEHARSEIFGIEAEGKKVIDDLAAMRAYLSSDTGERRLEMAHDISSLRVHVSAPVKAHGEGASDSASVEHAGDGSADAAATAEKPEAARPAAEKPTAEKPPGAVDGEPEREKMDSKTLIEETQKLLGRCRNLCLRAFALIDRVKTDSKRALGKVEDALARRTTDLAAKKKHLEMHALDVEAAIQVAERSLERMQRRLDPKDTKKAEKLKTDLEVLQQLQEARKALQDDIRNKFAALEIDNWCRRVTPAKADSAQREAAEKSAKMHRNSSAPVLRKKSDLTAGGSFYGSATAEHTESIDGSTMAPSSSAAGNSPALKAAGASLA